MSVKNVRLRQYAKESGVPLWMIAERLGYRDNDFSRLLRHELPESKQEEIFGLIDQIKAEELCND